MRIIIEIDDLGNIHEILNEVADKIDGGYYAGIIGFSDLKWEIEKTDNEQ